MAADEDELLKRRIQYSCNRLLRIVGRRFNEFPAASLETYLLSPLMGERPKLIRKSRSKNSELLVAGSSSASQNSLKERSGDKSVSCIFHSKKLVEAQKATKTAEKTAARSCIEAETAEARRQTISKRRE